MDADSLIVQLKPFSTFDEAPSSREDMVLCSTGRVGYLQGKSLEPRGISVANDSPLLAVLFLFVVVVLFNYHHCRRMFKNIKEDLVGVRRRANAFDDHTANELRASFVLILQMCVCQSLLLYYHFAARASAYEVMNRQLLMIFGLTAGLYLFQIVAYLVVGTVFADSASCKLWVRGYNVSAAISGIVLIYPTFIATFYPETTNAMIITALILFILIKSLFVIKGMRIFYDKIYSLLYFILYLCTLEIIPLIFVYSEVGLLCKCF